MAAEPDARALARRAAVTRELAALNALDPAFSPLAELAVVVEKKLGEGGMGTVHLVLDRRLGRKAALKVVRGDASAAAIARFEREAAVTARLDHPGIPPVYEAGTTTTGERFMLMRYVDGESLAETLARGKRSLSELLGILVKVGEAVASAHSKRIVHRDLKPANIMVGAFGEVLVMDWGIARNFDESAVADRALREGVGAVAPAGLTGAGTVLGTIGYMSPEQARNEEVDGRADVFSLGAILCTVLTGDPPIAGGTVLDALAATLEGKVVLPRSRRPGVPRELDAIAGKALAAAKEQRYASAEAFVADLRAYLEGGAVSVYRYGLGEQTRRLAKRHPTALATIGAIAVVSLGAAGVLARKNVQLDGTIAALEAETRARAKLERVRELLADARTRARQGAPLAQVRRLARDAIDADASEATLLDAGRLLLEVNDGEAETIFRRAADAFPPGYGALLALHEAEDRSRVGIELTPPLKEIVARARVRGDDNEFTAIAKCIEALERSDFAAALASAELAVKRGPRLSWAYVCRAVARGGQGDYDGSLVDCESALELDARSTRALNLRAMARGVKGDLDGALRDLDRLVELCPANSLCFANRAWLLYQKGDLDRSLADADRACNLDPASFFARLRRGQIRVARRDFQGALGDLERANQLRPGSAVVVAERGRVRLFQRDLEGALADASAAPGNLSTTILAAVRFARGDGAGAIADCTRVIDAAPKDIPALRLRGAARVLEGDADGDTDLARALAIRQHDLMTVAVRGLARFLRNDLRGAEDDLRDAVEKEPEIEEQPLVDYAPILSAAIARADELLARDANAAAVWHVRALARAVSHDNRGAGADLERFLSIAKDPEERESARRLLALVKRRS